ncbi:MAG: MgtC/SapB family protein, partial [Ignavibacteriales bacterium]|nr:MgtC/SapB family protein [Ignavibacteriales bacterium]
MVELNWTPELRLALALVLGFLVGLEREGIKAEQSLVFGGVRTHPLISLFGFGCAWLFHVGVVWMLPIGLIAVGSLTSVAYVAKIRNDRFGTTSEFSALLTFVTGALTMLVDVWVPMALGVVNAILLSEKAMLEGYVERLNRVEFLATLKFVLVTVIILPVLPNQEYTRFGLNPARIWQIVVLVSTIGFVGYLLEKRLGDKVGLWLSGLLGGIVSSTALTIAVGRMAQRSPERATSSLQAALLASSVMYLRVWVIIWFVNSAFIPYVWWKLATLSAIGVMLAMTLGKSTQRADTTTMEALQNPFEIRPSIVFAVVFVVLSVVTAFVKQTVGETGVVGLAAIVGVSDITPFILSIVQGLNGISSLIIAAIIVSTLSNIVAKAVYFMWLSPTTRKQTLIRFGVWALLHIPIIL